MGNRLSIVVGHSAKSPGASGAAPISLSEYRFHKEIIVPIMLKRAEKVCGLETKVFFRDGTDIGGVGKAVNSWAKGHNACSIELHFNAFDKKAMGTVTMYDSVPRESTTLAGMIHQSMLTVLKRLDKKGDRGIKLTDKGRGSYNLTSVLIPSVLVEPAFGDNPAEAKLLWENRVAYAEGLVDSAVKFLTKK